MKYSLPINQLPVKFGSFEGTVSSKVDSTDLARLLFNMRQQWLNRLEENSYQGDIFIRDEHVWQEIDHPHRSFSVCRREATDEELKIFEAFNTVLNTIDA